MATITMGRGRTHKEINDERRVKRLEKSKKELKALLEIASKYSQSEIANARIAKALQIIKNL